MSNIPFQTIDWDTIEKIAYPGETGTAYWQTMQLGGLRIRKVTYSVNYLADHWCQKDISCIASKETSSVKWQREKKLNLPQE